MAEDDGDLNKFLYGDEYSNLEETKINADSENGEAEEFVEEEEDDYEIILDTTKLPAGNASSSNDFNKRSLTSVAIGDGKGDEINGEGGSGADSSNPSGNATTATVSHFDPFAPGNLNGVQIYDHDLENFEDKPWRKPGADLTDYFNFGFNEVTWRAYCVKQKALREEFGLQKKIGVYDSGANMNSNTAGGSGYVNNNNNNNNNNIGGGNQPYNSYQNRPRRPPPPPPSPAGVGQMSYQNYQQQHQQHQHHNQQHHQIPVPPPPSHQDHRYPTYSRNDQSQQQGSYQGRQEYSRQPPSSSYHHNSRTRSRHEDSQSPPPPPPPPPSSRHAQSSIRDRSGSRSRSRSPDSVQHRTRYVSSGRSRYDENPRSPPSKRRRD